MCTPKAAKHAILVLAVLFGIQIIVFICKTAFTANLLAWVNLLVTLNAEYRGYRSKCTRGFDIDCFKDDINSLGAIIPVLSVLLLLCYASILAMVKYSPQNQGYLRLCISCTGMWSFLFGTVFLAAGAFIVLFPQSQDVAEFCGRGRQSSHVFYIGKLLEEHEWNLDDLTEDYGEVQAKELFAFYEYYETTYECAGICKRLTNFASKELQGKQPKEACAKYMHEDVLSNIDNFRNCLFASGIFFWLMMCVSCPVCAYEKRDEGLTKVHTTSVDYEMQQMS